MVAMQSEEKNTARQFPWLKDVTMQPDFGCKQCLFSSQKLRSTFAQVIRLAEGELAPTKRWAANRPMIAAELW